MGELREAGDDLGDEGEPSCDAVRAVTRTPSSVSSHGGRRLASVPESRRSRQAGESQHRPASTDSSGAISSQMPNLTEPWSSSTGRRVRTKLRVSSSTKTRRKPRIWSSAPPVRRREPPREARSRCPCPRGRAATRTRRRQRRLLRPATSPRPEHRRSPLTRPGLGSNKADLAPAQLSARVPAGRVPPATTAAAASWSAVRATPLGEGPGGDPGDAELLQLAGGQRGAGHADHAELLRPERLGDACGSRRGRPGRARRPRARRRRGTPGRAGPPRRSPRPRRRPPARTTASVRALSTKSMPASRPAASTASTAATASSSGFIWSSRLPPTTPTSMARRAVAPASPYPASRSIVTGRSTAATIRPTMSRCRSSGMFSPSS